MLAQRRPHEQVYVGPTSVSNVGPTESTTEKPRWANVVMLSGFLFFYVVQMNFTFEHFLNTCIYVILLYIGHERLATLNPNSLTYIYSCLEIYYSYILLQLTTEMKYFMHPNGD